MRSQAFTTCVPLGKTQYARLPLPRCHRPLDRCGSSSHHTKTHGGTGARTEHPSHRDEVHDKCSGNLRPADAHAKPCNPIGKQRHENTAATNKHNTGNNNNNNNHNKQLKPWNTLAKTHLAARWHPTNARLVASRYTMPTATPPLLPITPPTPVATVDVCTWDMSDATQCRAYTSKWIPHKLTAATRVYSPTWMVNCLSVTMRPTKTCPPEHKPVSRRRTSCRQSQPQRHVHIHFNT